MATTQISWAARGGFDIHVLRGHDSRRLDQLLQLHQSDSGPGVDPPTADAATLPPDVVRVEFRPRFRAQVAAEMSGHGVRVVTRTGQVTALPDQPSPAVANFLIEARVTVLDQGQQRVLPVVKVRVHVHRTVTAAWLTPSPLSIREGADGWRFSVLARFDDGTIGDLTEHPGITWTSAGALVSVDPTSGELAGTFSPGAPLVDIIASLPADLGPRTVASHVQVLPPWSSTRMPKTVTATPAGDWRELPNLLFVSEGFQDGEEREFERLVRSIVRRISSWKTTVPFDLLRQSINYWMMFVPSRDQGVSFLPECATLVRRQAKLRGTLVPFARPPAAGAAGWDLGQLVHEVGLPSPVEDSPANAKALPDKVEDWGKLYGTHVEQRLISPATYRDWLGLATRRLLNEHDTAFGLALGNRPNMELPGTQQFPPRRLQQDQLTDFLNSLRLGSDELGATWASGKDKGLVCVVLRTGFVSGMRFEGSHLLFSLGKERELEVRQALVGDGTEIVPVGIPRTLTPTSLGTVVHELAHTLHLGEEYGRRVRAPTSDEAAALAGDGNIQPRADLLKQPPQPDLDGGKIKWLWPRIEKAGVLAKQPERASANTLTITLRPGQAKQFAMFDIVRLRRRPLVQHPNASFRLRVTAPPDGDTLTVEQVEGLPVELDPDDFPTGADPSRSPILLAPVQRPGPQAPLGEELPLVAPVIRDHITATGLPLYSNPGPGCAPDDGPIQKPTRLPAGLPRNRPPYRAWIVGLYEGGEFFHCGVFHPTGACLMRNNQELIEQFDRVAVFCPVCRYVMVDVIDPTRHAALDRLYGKLYPQP